MYKEIVDNIKLFFSNQKQNNKHQLIDNQWPLKHIQFDNNWIYNETHESVEAQNSMYCNKMI